MDIEFIVDDEITDSDYRRIRDIAQAYLAERTYHDQPDSTAYLFITKNLKGNDAEGMASSNGNDAFGLGFGAFMFTDDITNKSSPDRTHHAKTAVHEIGHLLGTGRLDDKTFHQGPPLSGAEIYSGDTVGSTVDTTPETVQLRVEDSETWSVMSDGWNEDIDDDPMGGRYIAVSIEEMLELEFEDVHSKDS
jgi:hypothetical protein